MSTPVSSVLPQEGHAWLLISTERLTRRFFFPSCPLADLAVLQGLAGADEYLSRW